MFSFAVDYFVMVFVASMGVMQAAASIGGLRGLLVFKNPLVARALGIGVAIATVAWFFLVTERNVNDYEGGLDSNQQGLLFFLGVAASGIFTCVLTSVVNRRMADSQRGGKFEVPLTPTLSHRERGHDPAEAGLGVLRSGTWWQAVRHNYRYWFGEARCWRTRIKRYFSG